MVEEEVFGMELFCSPFCGLIFLIIDLCFDADEIIMINVLWVERGGCTHDIMSALVIDGLILDESLACCIIGIMLLFMCA